MINYQEIEEKIKSMTAHDIIMAMIEGLRNPKTKIDMYTFGEVRNGVCFGCAATNAILHIIGANEDEVRSHVTYTSTHDDYPLWRFEFAIDNLRMGSPNNYNEFATSLGIAQITRKPGQKLPVLNNDFTEEQLQEYVKLAEYNKVKEA